MIELLNLYLIEVSLGCRAWRIFRGVQSTFYLTLSMRQPLFNTKRYLTPKKTKLLQCQPPLFLLVDAIQIQMKSFLIQKYNVK